MTTTLELGQMVFGNPWGEYECPHWVDALVRELLREIERVFWNKNQREWDRCEDPKIPGVEFRPYYWGSRRGRGRQAESQAWRRRSALV